MNCMKERGTKIFNISTLKYSSNDPCFNVLLKWQRLDGNNSLSCYFLSDRKRESLLYSELLLSWVSLIWLTKWKWRKFVLVLVVVSWNNLYRAKRTGLRKTCLLSFMNASPSEQQQCYGSIRMGEAEAGNFCSKFFLYTLDCNKMYMCVLLSKLCWHW